MPAFERFDLNGRAASSREIARRWRDFHQRVRRANATPLARVVGPLLGDDTRRRRLAERWRPPAPAVTGAREPVTTFPHDYVRLDAAADVASLEVADHIEFVVLETDEPEELLEKFAVALTSTKEWLLVTHERDESARLAYGATLFAHGDDADVVFADEEGDVEGIPILKPSVVGPHTLLSYNVVGRPALLRRETVARLGGLRPEVGRASEHDLYLRLHENEARLHHVAIVMPGRRAQERHDPALASDTQRVVAEALLRRGITARVALTSRPSVVSWQPLPDVWPRVDILIPTRDRVDLLAQCVASVEASGYPNYAITILNNDSADAATLDYFAATPHRVVDCPGAFNYAAIINRGVEHVTGDYVLTLNNDTLVRTPDWLEQMVGVATLPDVSIVGVTLIDRDDVHDHDGIVMSPYPQHLRRGVNYLVEDEYVLARRDVVAVTGAVQLIARARYVELAGMDETLAVVMNDVDLCLRSQVGGRHVVMLPDVEMTHFASSTRGRLDPLADRNHFVRRWDVFGTFVDPYAPAALRLYAHTFEYHPAVAD